MSLTNILESLPSFKSDEILKAFVKGYSIINRPQYKNIICSVSGGSDSDIMLDLIYRIDEAKRVTYVWFDTGLEYRATKDHLTYLEHKYDIKIHRERAVKSIPTCTTEYGQPFLSKYISEQIGRLQAVNFDWKDKSFEELFSQYPNRKTSLCWWCNKYKERFNIKNGDSENNTESQFDINRYAYLKEFLIEYPPQFKISNKCCLYAKKKVSKKLISTYDCDLMIVGIRKAEGGIRATVYKNCFTTGTEKTDQYRPLFWFQQPDKEEYEQAFNIRHSDCYTKYGFVRTGCVCCPYGRNLLYELQQTKIYEPNMYKAVNNIFGKSYEYTQQYRQFVKEMRDRESGKKRLF